MPSNTPGGAPLSPQAQRQIQQLNERAAVIEAQNRVQNARTKNTKAKASERATVRAGKRAASSGLVHSPDLGQSHVFVRPGPPRIIDSAINIGGGAASTLWTTTRSTLASRIGWAAGFILIGGVAYFEAAGTELGDFGGGAAAANAAALGLMLFHPDLSKP